MRKFLPVSAAAACLILLSGCWNGRALLLFEQATWSSLGPEAPLRVALTRVTVARGFLPRIVVAGPDENVLERMAGEMATGRYGTVVVSPLASYEWRSFAPRYPRTRFILVGSIDAADTPANVVVLSYDRTAAFEVAGEAAGSAVRGTAGTLSAEEGALDTRISALLASASDVSDDEASAFITGAAKVLGGGRPGILRLPSGADRLAVLTAVQRLRGEGMQVVLLGLGVLDPEGLDALKATGGSAVVADWEESGASASQVLLSVEEDIPGGIARALAGALKGGKSVNGPVRLVKGRAAGPSGKKI